ncbi:DUF2970 domain-containing protein [Alteromonas sp. KUL49]|uniref:DUF2970 domain-containing protein n=1 Tax=Alteromonas sp. KUL49 TaxID=2480798 RepID=UPI001F5ED7B8|nr:DUF2970 domain-containing protein [Alteromonas sp. KUL49]
MPKQVTGLWSVICSVLASAFGVQSHDNYQRDFTTGRFISFVAVGIIAFIIFIAALLLLAKWVTTV